MKSLSHAYIRDILADSPMIYDRGKQTCENGSYFLSEKNGDDQAFVYEFDGTFGHYTTRVKFCDTDIEASCNCPYPGNGCRHVVAAALNARQILLKPRVQSQLFPDTEPAYLSEEQIREQALEERKERAALDTFTPIRGDMFIGDHRVVSKGKQTYTVCLHDPVKGTGHCSCPDYLTNGLGTCKHIIFMAGYLQSEPGFKKQVKTEALPFIDIFWDSKTQTPRLYASGRHPRPENLKPALDKYFNSSGDFTGQDISLIMGLMLRLHGDRRVRIRENLLTRVEHRLQVLQLKKMEGRPLPRINLLRPLFPFQKQGVDFGVLKTGVLIGDEMGLGKTAQAVAMALVKCETFGFSKILVITLASLKPKWKQEVEGISREQACIIKGTPARRRAMYNGKEKFKISHYEAVIQDAAAISQMNPDIIILDEAQRIRNYSTRTSDVVKRLPKKHAVVLTGTPLENKPEDLYSIVQFLDPYKFTPLWRFAANHYLIPKSAIRPGKAKDAVTKATGYKHLDLLKEKLGDIFIRRTWDDVQDQLPDHLTSTYFVELAQEQLQHHRACAGQLNELLNKKILTDMDMGKIRTQVLRMRMVTNSTFLVDRETQISPKLKELSDIIHEVVVQNQRKMVIFSEWTAMTFLIARRLSEAGIGFAEVYSKVAAPRRRKLAEQFAADPDCPIFLTTDAGSAGLDLSAARCMVNVELPWTPAQSARRKSCLVPRSHCGPCHIINLVGADSIEEGIHKGMTHDPDLLTALFSPVEDDKGIPEPQRREMADRLLALLDPPLFPKTTGGSGETPEENPYFLFPEAMVQGRVSDKKQLEDEKQLEKVLNSGLDFMAGLVEMATGRKTRVMEDKKIEIDPDTGKVSLSFTLPRELE